MTLGSDDLRAIRVFFGGVLLLSGFFGVGLLVARMGRPAASPAPSATETARRPDTERYLVEVAVLESQEKATELVQQLRRQYASAWTAQDAGDRQYHVYAGPYPLEQSQTVAQELVQQGVQSVTIKPYQPRPTPGV
jgi:cell division septation protein DedD